MSTTVSYKGQTLTTVSNDTKTLLTEGKYLEDDLTLVDVSGGGSTLITKNISANGTYNASSDSADGYSQVTVAVPASAVDTGTKSISTNGTHDVVGYASASVSVPNSYSASDEGKVVSNGALVAQTAHADVTPTTSDQTIDTTTNNSIKVKGDADLVASNIKKDVEIFGVTGSYEGGGGGTDYLAQRIMQTLTQYESDEVTKIGDYSLNRTTDLTRLILPNCKTIGLYALGFCTNLSTIRLGLTGAINMNGMQNCTSLTVFDADHANDFYGNCFASCSKLATLILRHTSVVNLRAITSFNSTPFASNGTGGTLYVPSALISSYQSATNWSTILGYTNNSIAAIEGSQYENYYADGAPIS